MNTPNVCNGPTGSCVNDYSTVNFNNYIMTNNAGGGPSYTNMCARVSVTLSLLCYPVPILCKGKYPVQVTKSDGSPMQLLGDGNYHNYTIEWHTGTSSAGGPTTSAFVNFYIDGVYMGTNNAFVPTRAGRLWISLWPAYGTYVASGCDCLCSHWNFPVVFVFFSSVGTATPTTGAVATLAMAKYTRRLLMFLP
jgi:hypothetical protein